MTQPPRIQSGDTPHESPCAELREYAEPAPQPAAFLNAQGHFVGRTAPAELMAVLTHVFPEIGDLRAAAKLPD
jgi:hypothetical protein